MKSYAFLFTILTLLTGCGTGQSSPKPIDTTTQVGQLYAGAGKPRSKDYHRTIPGMADEGATPNIKKPVIKKPVTVKKPIVKKDPWVDNSPVSPEDGLRLEAVYQQAWEFYRAAEQGQNAQKNWLKAAELFITGSRLPEKERRSNCLYNASCSYALAGKKKEAVKFLILSVDLGFRDFAHIKKDTDLKNIRKEKGYLALLKKYKADKDPINKRPVNPPLKPEELIEIFKAGDKLYEAKKYEPAAGLYIQSAAHAGLKKDAFYNAACCYALAGKKEKALKALQSAIKAGWKDAAHLKKDNDLKSLRNTDEFKKIIAGLEGKKPGVIKPAPGLKPKPDKIEPKELSPEERETLYKAYKEGDKLYKDKKYAEAAEKFSKSSSWKSLAKNAHYNAACCWALAGKPEKALESLKMAVKSGWKDGDHLAKDGDLKSLRKRDDFQSLLKALKAGK